MALFEYKGVLKDGKNTKGSIEADSSKSARIRLKSQGIYVTTITSKKTSTKQENKSVFSFGGVKLHDIAVMNRQLATLVKARIPLDDALNALVSQTENTKLKTILSQVRTSVNEGSSLANSCNQFPKVFSPMYVSMVRVGEASGNLDLVLNRLADFSEAQNDLKNKVMGAMAYPAVMMVAGTGITLFLFAFAVPKITEVFAGSKMVLPLVTRIMIGISAFVSAQWPTLILLMVGTFFFFKWYTGTKKGRDRWDALSLRLPIMGKLKRKIAVSRFARTMSTLVGSGVQILDAIDIVKDVVDNSVIRNALVRSRESIREGRNIAGPLKQSGEFPPIVTHMIAVGEKTGELEDMLNVVADAYDSEVDTAIKSMTRLLEPIMILVMGSIIALVALSIFIPMLQMNDLVTL